MTVITIPKALREKLSDEGVDALIEIINKADEKQKEDVLKFLEEKFEVKLDALEEKFGVKLNALEEKVGVKLNAFEEKVNERFSSFEEKINTKLSVLEEKFERRLAEEIGSLKADIIKWMFVFIVGQFWAIIGTLFVFFRK